MSSSQPMVALLVVMSSLLSDVALAEAPSEFLKTLVNINSGTENVEGVNQVQGLIAERLRKLGFEVELKKNPDPRQKSGDLLVGTLKGASPKWITVIVHSDTVFEPSSPFQKFTISEDGKSAHGPGVADDKGGIVVALHGLEKFLKEGRPRHSFRFIASPSEETGSTGFVSDFKKYGKEAWMVLSFEPSHEDGSIVKSRKGNRWYQVKVTGKEAHAGRDHHSGVNACVELSRKLVEVSKLTDYRKNVTVSVGRMEGGQDKFNIVCSSAQAKIDTRFADFKSRDELSRKIRRILEKAHVHSHASGLAATTEWTLEDDSAPFSANKASQVFIKKYIEAVKAVEGRMIGAHASGGVGDANAFSHEDAVILDGLGPIGGKMHTVEESIELSTLETRAESFRKFLQSL